MKSQQWEKLPPKSKHGLIHKLFSSSCWQLYQCRKQNQMNF